MKGTYIIVIYLLENSKIKIGSLGEIDFVEGNTYILAPLWEIKVPRH